MREITISIDRTAQLKRVEQATWKQGKALEQPKVVKQTYNIQADTEVSVDNDLLLESFEQWLWLGVDIMREYLASAEYGEKPNDQTFTITLNLPKNWVIHSTPGLKYAVTELIHNGMLADWCENVKPDQANDFRKKTEMYKAEIKSIVYSVNPPPVEVESEAGYFDDELASGQEGQDEENNDNNYQEP